SARSWERWRYSWPGAGSRGLPFRCTEALYHGPGPLRARPLAARFRRVGCVRLAAKAHLHLGETQRAHERAHRNADVSLGPSQNAAFERGSGDAALRFLAGPGPEVLAPGRQYVCRACTDLRSL